MSEREPVKFLPSFFKMRPEGSAFGVLAESRGRDGDGTPKVFLLQCGVFLRAKPLTSYYFLKMHCTNIQKMS